MLTKVRKKITYNPKKFKQCLKNHYYIHFAHYKFFFKKLKYSKLNYYLSILIHNAYISTLESICIEYNMCDPNMGKRFNKYSN